MVFAWWKIGKICSKYTGWETMTHHLFLWSKTRKPTARLEWNRAVLHHARRTGKFSALANRMNSGGGDYCVAWSRAFLSMGHQRRTSTLQGSPQDIYVVLKSGMMDWSVFKGLPPLYEMKFDPQSTNNGVSDFFEVWRPLIRRHLPLRSQYSVFARQIASQHYYTPRRFSMV